MPRTTIRLASFAVILAALFTGGWAVGEQFPTDRADHPADHPGDHPADDHPAGHEGSEVAP